MTAVESKPEVPVPAESESASEYGSEPSEATGHRRRRNRTALVGGAAVLVIGAAGGGVYVWQTHNKTSGTSTTTTALPTAAVVRTDLVSRADEDGTLGFGDSRSVLAGGTGRITWLPAAGAVINRGARAYGVDGHGIGLLYGSTPFWRTLQSGMTKGYDVLELERNLQALGYADGLTVDRTFSSATATAVKRWQKALGMSRTGSLEPGDVVVEPGAVRVAKAQATLSAPAAGTVYTVTGTQRQVTAQLSVSDAQTLARKGAKVQVTLPGGAKVGGTVSAVGAVATADSGGSASQTGSNTKNAKITVTVTLAPSSAVSALDGAPVTVGFTSAEHKGVLAVPVNSLLAASDNTYSVKVVGASGTVTSVPVKLGIFDGDNVEVTGALTAGDKVQVPQS
jgi:peptidoglycan hydrolase-like protein with peptidoglycan-binding domain